MARPRATTVIEFRLLRDIRSVSWSVQIFLGSACRAVVITVMIDSCVHWVAGSVSASDRTLRYRSLASVDLFRRIRGLWRSLVAHYTGGVGVAGSNPVSPTATR